MKRRTTALVILFALAAILILLAQANIHAGPAPQADAREVLMKADADFDAAVAEKGIDAWVASLRGGWPDVPGRRARPWKGRDPRADGPGVRHARVLAALETGRRRHRRFRATWVIHTEPTRTALRETDGKPEVRTGMYVTIWKKQADGSWKAAVDLGSAAPPPAEKP